MKLNKRENILDQVKNVFMGVVVVCIVLLVGASLFTTLGTSTSIMGTNTSGLTYAIYANSSNALNLAVGFLPFIVTVLIFLLILGIVGGLVYMGHQKGMI